jgi:cytochrome c biogenesis protein CcdA/thiol-disulfide isomerase/thioredoxin
MGLSRRWSIILCLIASLMAFSLAVSAQSNTTARAVLFYSPTCPHCVEVLEHVLPPLEAQYGGSLEIRMLNLMNPQNYQIYTALHQQVPNLPEGIPQLYIDDYVLVGTLEIQEYLPTLIEQCLGKGGCDYPFSAAPVDARSAALSASANPVYLAYAFDPSCLECDRVTYDLNYLQTQYPNLVIRRFNIWEEPATLEALAERYQVPESERLHIPAVFIDDQYFIQQGITLAGLSAAIEGTGTHASAPPWEGLDEAAVASASGRIVERFGSFSVLAVAAAGLLDGVNPCAFATIIFFISYLTLVGRGKREVLAVGIAFTLAVFLTYLTMGMGLATIIERIGAVSTIARIIYGGTALICIALAILSLWDYAKIRQGKLSEIALQLPKALKKRIHSTIRTHSRMRGFIAAAFGAGILVSVFELACTGQVYLPTIVFMTSVAEMRLSAVGYLVIYNALFVVPLVIVFAITYFGVSSQKLTAAFQTNAGAVKLLTTALFTVLAIWLIVLLLG